MLYAICDLGTNLYDLEAVSALLPHFLKHYDELGVQKYLFFGNAELCAELQPSYADDRFVFISITSEALAAYQAAAEKISKQIEDSSQKDRYRISDSDSFWIIGNAIKRQYVTDDDWAFVLDLDEFVSVSKQELQEIQNSDASFACGKLIDMIAADGSIPPLVEGSIYEQFPVKTKFTLFAGRADHKLWLSKGKLEHCYGHHYLYDLDSPAKNVSKLFEVMHFKWFAQNLVHLKRCPFCFETNLLLNDRIDSALMERIRIS